MAAKPKRTKSHWYDGTTPFEDLDVTQQLAHDIVTERSDLTPSVERIMSAELSDEQRHQALEAFAASLAVLDDPNRDPRVAIANAMA
ncbi:MAG: hypothetical protein ACOYMR_02570 [Ilumatobacteraceae bacterium]|jgi:hypothetical protein